MKTFEKLINGYENTSLLDYRNPDVKLANTVKFEDVGNRYMGGVLKANRYINGELTQTYSSADTHILTIAATRVGKTTSCVIPQIYSFASQKVKRPMVISDPKGELYRLLADYLKKQRYDVMLLNLRDYSHSEYWNPLTPVYRKYQEALNVEDEVSLVQVECRWFNKFRGVLYEDQSLLDEAVEQVRRLIMSDVESEIDTLMYNMIPPDNAPDQYWNEASRQWGKALILSMLEDSVPKNGKKIIDEDNFSLDTMFRIFDKLSEESNFDDDDYFSSRGDDSRAYQNAKIVVHNPAHVTRSCIVSCFNTKVQAYKNSGIRLLTRCNSFEMSRLTSGKPVAVFIAYPDENKVYYQIISSFVQSAYKSLIDFANEKPGGKLDVPFYFMLDEFGNFPKIPDFETVISACGGRNIWFDIVLQSFAQLNNVYGSDTAEIIRDNLNMHIFLGSNNPSTLEEFSKECGETTRISPMSALNGDKKEISQFTMETVRLVPKSALTQLGAGECVVTEANCGYVLFSKMERYFTCKEYARLVSASEKDYVSDMNPLEKKYDYVWVSRVKRPKFDF